MPKRESEMSAEVIGIGRAPRRKEDLRFLTGRGNYVADIKRPGMTAGVFVRSPHAHAVITSIDGTAARARPCGWGITGRDGLPMKEPPHPALAIGKVRYVGDAVAFVVAETLENARAGA